MRVGTPGEMYLSLLKTLNTMASTSTRSNPGDSYSTGPGPKSALWAVLVRAGVTRQGRGLEGRVPMRARTLGEMYLTLLKTLNTMASTSTCS
jgi:hypothetical protein